MNIKTIISFGLALGFLSSCSFGGGTAVIDTTGDIKNLIQSQKEIEKDVSLVLTTEKQSYFAGEKFQVKVMLINPTGKNIDSVRSWLTFNPDQLKVETLGDSDFDLTLSQENTFDNANGVISIGRSSQEKLNKTALLVQTIEFSVLSLSTVKKEIIDFFDYKSDVSGHTGVYRVIENETYNVMAKPEYPSLLLELFPPQEIKKIKRN